MGIKQLFSCLLVIFLSSCAVLSKNTDLVLSQEIETPEVLNLQSEELLNLPPAEHKPVIAVYANSFQDLTGQRKSNSSFAMFSTAVTQAPEALLIRALKHAANGKFFRVVERVGLENLTKERQLIRSTRENFEEDQQLQPLLFAGIIVQGGVIAFDTNIESGGIGARYLGIGNSTVYREDIVTISGSTMIEIGGTPVNASTRNLPFLDIPFPIGDSSNSAAAAQTSSYNFADNPELYPKHMTIWVQNFPWVSGNSNGSGSAGNNTYDSMFYVADSNTTTSGSASEAEVFIDSV